MTDPPPPRGHQRFVHSQVALFYAGSEFVRTNLVVSLMRMRTLDVAIRQHLRQAEDVKQQLLLCMAANTAGRDDQHERTGTAKSARASRKRLRAADTPAPHSYDDDTARLGEKQRTLVAQLHLHCDMATSLSIERQQLADNSVSCAQDMYVSWRLRVANLRRALQLHHNY